MCNHRRLLAERVVGVGGGASEGVGTTDHVAVGVVAKLARRGRLRGDVVPDGPGLQRAIRVEDEAGERGRRAVDGVGHALRVVAGVVVERAHIAQLVGRRCRLGVLVVGRIAGRIHALRDNRIG